MEHLVTSHIMKHADANNIMYPLQHRFRRGYPVKRNYKSLLMTFQKTLTRESKQIV